MAPISIRVSEVKTRPVDFLMRRLMEARQAGKPVLDVLNRGQAVCHLGLAEDMPPVWLATDPPTVPLSDLKRSQVSISHLRREERAILLTQRSGPTLALWPVETLYERPDDLQMSEELDYLRREVRKLMRRVTRIEGQLAAVKKIL